MDLSNDLYFFRIQRIQFLGIAERIKKNYWAKYDKSPPDTWTPVHIENVSMIFAIMGVGILISSGIFIIEFILRFRKPKTDYKIFFKKNSYDGYIIRWHFFKNFQPFSKNF